MSSSGKYVMPDGFHVYEGMYLLKDIRADVIDKVKEFKFDGDILIASYPKTGTTWLEEMTWLVNSEGNFEGADGIQIQDRVKFIEMFNHVPHNRPVIELLETRDPPRMIKSHLPLKYFKSAIDAGKVKVLVPLRNPKDTLVSLFHFYRMSANLGKFSGSFEEFFEIYCEKRLMYGDVVSWYSDCWQYKDHPNVLILKYEDMKRDLKQNVIKISSFIGKELPDDVIDEISKRGQFESMRDNKQVNYRQVPETYFDQKISPFMRKGQVGDWKNYFTEEQSKFLDRQCEEHLSSIELTFDYEL